MPLTITPEPGETILLDPQEFALGITDRAIFLPKKKLFAVEDPWSMKRIPRGEVREVRIRRLRSEWMFALAFAMILGGGLTSYWLFLDGGRISGIALGVLVAGIVLPFVSRGRFGLVITMEKGKFKWKPPIVIDSHARNEVRQIFDMTAAASRKAGLPLIDERGSRA